MAAFKKLEGRLLFVDMTEIHVPSWKIREVQKAAAEKTRLLRKLDPLARCCGRKLKFKTPKELRDACDKYFKDQEYVVRDKFGTPITDPDTGKRIISTHPLTISGLARSIGVATETLKRYRNQSQTGVILPEYGEIVNEALQRIEEYAERRIYDRDGTTGAQFILRAGFRWRTDKEEIEFKRAKSDLKNSKKKMKMAEEKHNLEMELLKKGIDGGEDKEINITITRAKKDDTE